MSVMYECIRVQLHEHRQNECFVAEHSEQHHLHNSSRKTFAVPHAGVFMASRFRVFGVVTQYINSLWTPLRLRSAHLWSQKLCSLLTCSVLRSIYIHILVCSSETKVFRNAAVLFFKNQKKTKWRLNGELDLPLESTVFSVVFTSEILSQTPDNGAVYVYGTVLRFYASKIRKQCNALYGVYFMREKGEINSWQCADT